MYTALAPYLGFTSLPLKFYPALGLIVVLYVLFVETAKKIFLQRWLQKSTSASVRRLE